MSDAPVDDPPALGWHRELVALYERRYDHLVRLAYLLTGRAAEAEEIVQDAYVAARRSWSGVRDPYPYLRSAVANRCRSWGRRQVLERERRPRPAEPAELVADEMWDALATLPERQRTAIVLRYWADLPDAEIAEVLGCRPATVRTTLHRGIAALREVVDR